MKSRVEAIIISSMNLGEADKLVTFFSRERGKLRGTAKNARRSFRRFGAGLEAFTHCRLQLHEREHQELLRIESSEILHQHPGISADLLRMAAGSVMLELVRELAPDSERNEPVFSLLAGMLAMLHGSDDPAYLLRIFEIKLLSLLGYQPKLDHCLSCGCSATKVMIFSGLKGGALCPACMVSSGDDQARISAGAIGFYYQALRMDMDKVCRLKPSQDIMRELDRAFFDHTLHILGRRLRTREFLLSMRRLEVSPGA